MKHPCRQQGVAVITALLIVALAAIISAGIATDLQLEVRRTANLVNTDHRYYDDSVGPYEDVARAFVGYNGGAIGEAGQIRPINSNAWAVGWPRSIRPSGRR